MLLLYHTSCKKIKYVIMQNDKNEKTPCYITAPPVKNKKYSQEIDGLLNELKQNVIKLYIATSKISKILAII